MSRDPAVDEAFVCEACGERWYYTRVRCPDCGSDAVGTYELDAGEVLAVTEVAVTPPDVRSPNRLGLVSFDGVRLIAQLDDEATSGDSVAFAGRHRLRTSDDSEQPRLTTVERAPTGGTEATADSTGSTGETADRAATDRPDQHVDD